MTTQLSIYERRAQNYAHGVIYRQSETLELRNGRQEILAELESNDNKITSIMLTSILGIGGSIAIFKQMPKTGIAVCLTSCFVIWLCYESFTLVRNVRELCKDPGVEFEFMNDDNAYFHQIFKNTYLLKLIFAQSVISGIEAQKLLDQQHQE